MIVGNFLSKSCRTRALCEDLAERLSEGGVRVTTTSNKQGRVIRLLDMLKTVWTRRNEYQLASIDVFSGNAFVWAESVAFVLRRLGKPYILTLRGGGLPVFAERWPGRVRRLFASTSIVTVPSQYLFVKMEQYNNNLCLLPNPVNISDYHFRMRTNLRPVLIWLRSFHNVYNPTLAPRTLARLVSEVPDVSLTMAGTDMGDGSLQATNHVVFELGVAANISFPGLVPKNQVPEYLDEADIFINTTNIDNTPVSILEAMASGLCIVSTNVGGIPYLLDDEENALLVPPDDPEAMAHAVSRILNEPGLASRLSENARRKVEQFDWPVILRKWESLFQELYGKGKS